jgi:putative membrane protein
MVRTLSTGVGADDRPIQRILEGETPMPMNYGRTCMIALSAAALLVGCKAKENASTDTSTAAGAVATGSDSANRAKTDSANAAANNNNNNWTDGQILAFATAANKGEIAEGKIAETKATNPKVKSYARTLVTDHTTLLNEGNAFAKKNNITPDSTKSDVQDLQKDAQSDIQDMNSKAKGKDWDKDFVDKEIDGHQKVLQKLQQAQSSTQNAQLKEMLTKAEAKVQEHLQKAQALKDSTLNKS